MNCDFIKQLASPDEIKGMFPVSEEMKKTVADRQVQIENIFEGKDKRKLLIIGPCSADNEDSVVDYVSRLVNVQEKVKDKILIIPRIYTNKPRTTGEGYKGMLHQPNPTEKPDLVKGIIATRHMHMRALQETGFSCADEMLYPENYQYLDDILAYVAIGARSVEDQQHRLVASGINNPTSGDYSVMMNAIHAAQGHHTFIYRGWEVHSHGNAHCHAILRGYTNKMGKSRPNYHYEDIIRLCDVYDANEHLTNPSVIVDCNHANSGKNPFEQPRIVMDVLHSAGHSERIAKLVKGFMIESYIEDGAQKPGDGCYGKSITDACLGWEKTEDMIYRIAEKL